MIGCLPSEIPWRSRFRNESCPWRPHVKSVQNRKSLLGDSADLSVFDGAGESNKTFDVKRKLL